MLTKFTLNMQTMKFHRNIHSFSLFQQLPYFEQSNRKNYHLTAFDHAVDYNGNRLYLLLDLTHKVVSVFSLETDCGQKQVVPFKQAVMGDHDLIKALPAKNKD